MAFPFARQLVWEAERQWQWLRRRRTAGMTQSQRKLIGTVMMLVLLVAYPLLGMLGYVTWFAAAPWWGALLYALIVGLGWALPAMAIIGWMVRPSRAADAAPRKSQAQRTRRRSGGPGRGR
jgi:hypothetical protein